MQTTEELNMHPKKKINYTTTTKKNLYFYFWTSDNEMLLQTAQ